MTWLARWLRALADWLDPQEEPAGWQKQAQLAPEEHFQPGPKPITESGAHSSIGWAHGPGPVHGRRGYL